MGFRREHRVGGGNRRAGLLELNLRGQIVVRLRIGGEPVTPRLDQLTSRSQDDERQSETLVCIDIQKSLVSLKSEESEYSG